MGDGLGGITVAIVALPLAMAFAIASGVGPEKGLITAIVAGIIASLFGGNRVQISGPTGAFVVVIYDIVSRYGYEGLAVATVIAGFLLILMGLFRFGAVIKFIPYPVITGFTAGIALLIFSSQVADMLGLGIEQLPGDFVDKWIVILSHLAKTNGYALVLGILCVGLIVASKRYVPKLPGPIVAVIAGAFLVQIFALPVETIQSRFGEISLTSSSMDWASVLNIETIKALFPSAMTIAILAAIESVLCAVVADGMTGSRNNVHS